MDPVAAGFLALGCTLVCGFFIVLVWEWVTE